MDTHQEDSSVQDPFEFVDHKGRPVEMPSFIDRARPDTRVADTHAHLDMLDDPAVALARAAYVGVDFVVTISDVVEGAAATFDDLSAWQEGAANLLRQAGSDLSVPEVHIVVGAHPHNAKRYVGNKDAIDELRRRVRDPRVCGIGEVGLDYYYDHSPRDVQQEAYREHIALAQESGLPIVIHLRDAHEDGLRILEEVGVPEAGAILHCFNRDFEVARPFMELGCHVSFAGPVTFKKAEEVREAATQIPLDRILTETDCPFMAPEPFRGSRCEPAFTAWTAARIASVREEVLGEDPSVFFSAAYENARALLGEKRMRA